MSSISNYFTSGVMNQDLDERVLPEGTYREALNITVENSTGSNSGAIHNSLGNTIVSNLSDIVHGYSPLTSNAKTIGAVVYEQNHLIYWLVAADNFDAILEYNASTQQTTSVLVSTTGQLNFSQEYLVTGINYINGYLYWTDNYNPPRKINISRAKTYLLDDPRIDDDINVIVEPPLNAPSIRMFNDPSSLDSSQHNNIDEKFIYFSYRYEYIDGQHSSMSPFSAVAFNPKNFVLDFNIGNTKTMVNRYNSAEIQLKTGGKNVKKIQLIMRDTRSLNCNIIEAFDKSELAINDNSFYKFIFNNNKTYAILEQAQVTRLFDNVPLLAKSQDFVGNRIMYGNYTQFYDIEKPVLIDVKYASVDNNGASPIQTFRSDRDYEIGVLYMDKYGRHTTVLTSTNNTVYIPPTQSDKGNSLDVTLYNTPPSWATNYRLVIKQSKGEYYNILPMYFYTYGQFRYFLIHESDKDKFAVGDYLIFKCDAGGPTYSNKKYKILEFKSQPAGFLGISGALEGLYIKIKVDYPNELNSTSGLTSYWFGSFGANYSPFPLGSLSYAEKPIYYGNSNPNSISTILNPTYPIGTTAQLYSGDSDYRITIEVISLTEFKWTKDVSCSGGWVYVNINLSSYHFINPTSLSDTTALAINNGISIVWSSQPSIGDIWKINLRSSPSSSGINYFGGNGPFNPNPVTATCPLTLDQNQDVTIYPGDIIQISFQEDYPNSPGSVTQTFYSNGTYENIEEWFVESGEYLNFQHVDSNGINQGAKSVSFRRGTSFQTINTPISHSSILSDTSANGFLNYPIYMLIKGSYIDNYINRMSASITVKHLQNAIIAETVGVDSDIDIYHELSETYPVSNGYHKVLWDYADFTAPSYANGKTNLGQLAPGSAITPTDVQHNFHVGEKVYVHSTNNTYLQSGPYTILQVPDPYNVVIDLDFPVSGPATPGGISYYQFEQDQFGKLCFYWC